MNKAVAIISAAIVVLLALNACQNKPMPSQELAAKVDLKRFMGKWHVHGYTPTMLDKKAYAATETYEMRYDGKIQTTYQFHKGGPEGKLKTYRPVGSVYDTDTNAEWRMRFFGIINAPYYIVYVDDDYRHTVIGHPGKEMAWIMSRSPQISDAQYAKLLEQLSKRDYNIEKLERVLHP